MLSNFVYEFLCSSDFLRLSACNYKVHSLFLWKALFYFIKAFLNGVFFWLQACAGFSFLELAF